MNIFVMNGTYIRSFSFRSGFKYYEMNEHEHSIITVKLSMLHLTRHARASKILRHIPSNEMDFTRQTEV